MQSSSGRRFSTLDSYKYVGFEDQFRGSREDISARLESYLPVFAGAADVLDIGCGRGEFLELLAGAGIRARGIDLNHEMAELCRSRGLDVTEADAVGYLSTLPDASLGGIFAAQVVEHLQPGYLLRFLELAFHKVRPGGRIVLETLNPACWVAFFDSYIRDITHVWPLHPETLKYLVLASGFTRADLEYRSPVAAENRLQAVALPNGADAPLAELDRDIQCQRRKAQLAPVHAPRLRRDRSALTKFYRGASPLGLPCWLARGGPDAPLRSPGSLATARSHCF